MLRKGAFRAQKYATLVNGSVQLWLTGQSPANRRFGGPESLVNGFSADNALFINTNTSHVMAQTGQTSAHGHNGHR